MITEVVKVDAKGRITIPAYVRLLLNVDEGSKIVLNVDEDKGVMVMRTFREDWVRCEGVISKQELVKILNEVKVIVIKCFDSGLDEYRCDIVLEVKDSLKKVLGNLRCFND